MSINGEYITAEEVASRPNVRVERATPSTSGIRESPSGAVAGQSPPEGIANGQVFVRKMIRELIRDVQSVNRQERMPLYTFASIMSKVPRNLALQAVLLYYTIHHLREVNTCATCFDRDITCSEVCKYQILTNAYDLLFSLRPETWRKGEQLIRQAFHYFANNGNMIFHDKYARAYFDFHRRLQQAPPADNQLLHDYEHVV